MILTGKEEGGGGVRGGGVQIPQEHPYRDFLTKHFTALELEAIVTMTTICSSIYVPIHLFHLRYGAFTIQMSISVA